MAEIVFRDMVERAGLSEEFFVRSTATSTEEIGNPVYPPARRELLSHGLSAEGKRAVQFTRLDYDEFDILLVMDGRNIRNAGYIIGNDDEDKLIRLMEFTGCPRDVSDPWYSGDFETCYRDVYEGCEGLLRALSGDVTGITERARKIVSKILSRRFHNE